MGLFNRNKKSAKEEYQELYAINLRQIEEANYNVRLDYAIGQYGNEDIIAGAMIGETGKYLMMNKYGDAKWESITMALLADGVQLHYDGTGILYTDIIEVRATDNKGLLNVDKQMHLITKQGNYIFKGPAIFVDVIINLILNSKQRYEDWVSDGLVSLGQDLSPEDVEKLFRGESVKIDEPSTTKSDDGSNADRLLRCAELYERGLLSKEEFEEMKKKLI